MITQTQAHVAFNIVNNWVNEGYTEDRLEYTCEDIMEMENCDEKEAMLCIAHLARIAQVGESKWLQEQIKF